MADSTYTTKNYSTKNGDEWVIGGKLTFASGGLLPNQAADTAGTTASLKASLNALLTKLKDSGLMIGDAFSMTVNHSVNDTVAGHADRTYNTGKITDVAIADGVITITLSEKVSALKDFDGGNGWGIHKWLGIGVSAGITPITGLSFNGSELTSDDVSEATAVGLSEGYFVLWLKAERIVQGLSNTFRLWASNYAETEFTIKIVEPA